MGDYIRYTIKPDGLYYMLFEKGAMGASGWSRGGYGEYDSPDEPDKLILEDLIIPVEYFNYNKKNKSDIEWISRINVRLYRYFLENKNPDIYWVIKDKGFHYFNYDSNLEEARELENLLNKLLKFQKCSEVNKKKYKYFFDYYNKVNVIPETNFGKIVPYFESNEISSISFDLSKYTEYYINSKFKISKGLFKLEVDSFGSDSITFIIRAPITYYDYNAKDGYRLRKDYEKPVIYEKTIKLPYFHASVVGYQIDFNIISQTIEKLLPEIYEACNNFKDDFSDNQINLIASFFYKTDYKDRLKSFNTILRGIKTLCYDLSKMIRENKFYGLQYEFYYEENEYRGCKSRQDGDFYVRFYIPYYIKEDNRVSVDKFIIKDCSICSNKDGKFSWSIIGMHTPLNPEPLRDFYNDNINNKKIKYNFITGNYEKLYERLCNEYFDSISNIEIKKDNFKKALELKDAWIKKIEEEDYQIEAIKRKKEELKLELERKNKLECEPETKDVTWWQKIKNIFA